SFALGFALTYMFGFEDEETVTEAAVTEKLVEEETTGNVPSALQDETILDSVINPMAIHSFLDTFSLKNSNAINAVATISKLPRSDALEGSDSFQFSIGSFFVILATCCWGLENNCTRKMSDKSTYEIVLLKGIFSGGGSFTIALLLGEKIPEIKYIAEVMLLGFVAYGLSIFLYIRAQRDLGAAKTSSFYAVAPFVGSFLAFAVNGEKLALEYFIGLALMLLGTVFVVYDTMVKHHLHEHTHTIVHTHNGVTHTHVISHEHEHKHFGNEERHNHKHEDYINSQEHKLAHANGL
ncbi:DMT family transporter, partial [Streptococcus sanguinis]|uniref:DMT family transporter n=1 Tax=Streptococcus sanguinis TaxID=1305 RepID=UPI003857D2A4